MNDLKVGEIDKGGWEVCEVYYVTQYKKKKRIIIIEDIEYNGISLRIGDLGYIFLHTHYHIAVMDKYKSTEIKLRVEHYDFLENYIQENRDKVITEILK